MRILITGGTLVTPYQRLPGHTLVVQDGQIAALEPHPVASQPGDQVIDAQGMWVAPGMIDVHVHGGDGCDTMDATPLALETIARFFAAHGVTAFLPTTMTCPGEAITAAVENVRRSPSTPNGAAHLGVHLEGPYLNASHKGAQPATHLRNPDPAEYQQWFDSGVIRLVTVAPELDGALDMIGTGVARGIEFAVGHSSAEYACVLEAADRGLRQVTHTFNGMSPLHHREPGVLGAALSDDRLFAQIISDGIHVHPAVVKALIRAKGVDRTLLITDAMRAAGLPGGTYDLGGQEIAVHDGIARTASGSLAGSTLTMDRALRNVIEFAGLELGDALKMATTTPAATLGLSGCKGVLAPGADADIILLTQDLEVALTMVAGRVVYSRPQ